MAAASIDSGGAGTLPTTMFPVPGDYDGDGRTDIAYSSAAVLRQLGTSCEAQMARFRRFTGRRIPPIQRRSRPRRLRR